MRIILITGVFCSSYLLPSVITNENGAVIQLSHVSLHRCAQLTPICACVCDVIALIIACARALLRIDSLTLSYYTTTVYYTLAENVTKLQFKSYDFIYLKVKSFLRCSSFLCACLMACIVGYVILILDKHNLTNNYVWYLHIICAGISASNSVFLLRCKYLNSICLSYVLLSINNGFI